MTALPRWLFVSKPIAPPWRDGSVNLVRDLATHVRHVQPYVFSTLPKGQLEGVEFVAQSRFKFASAQMHVLGHVAASGYAGLHFVFAPNPRSSYAARVLLGLRRTLGRTRSVQTIASPPLTLEGCDKLLFGDVVVAQSEWMRRALRLAGVVRQIDVIPPCARAPAMPTAARVKAVRTALGLHGGPLFIYPGDYELSTGAATVAASAPALVAAGAQVVFACRPKTPRAAAVRAQLQLAHQQAGIEHNVFHAGVVEDLPALLACATAVLFPVDNLYGKVDLPLVLLESMALGTPIIAASGGPLEELTELRLVPPGDAQALAEQAIGLLRDPALAGSLAARARSVYDARYSPAVVAAQYDAVYKRLG